MVKNAYSIFTGTAADLVATKYEDNGNSLIKDESITGGNYKTNFSVFFLYILIILIFIIFEKGKKYIYIFINKKLFYQ